MGPFAYPMLHLINFRKLLIFNHHAIFEDFVQLVYLITTYSLQASMLNIMLKFFTFIPNHHSYEPQKVKIYSSFLKILKFKN